MLRTRQARDSWLRVHGSWLNESVQKIEFFILTSLTHLIALDPSVYRTLPIVRCLGKRSLTGHYDLEVTPKKLDTSEMKCFR